MLRDPANAAAGSGSRCPAPGCRERQGLLETERNGLSQDVQGCHTHAAPQLAHRTAPPRAWRLRASWVPASSCQGLSRGPKHGVPRPPKWTRDWVGRWQTQ